MIFKQKKESLFIYNKNDKFIDNNLMMYLFIFLNQLQHTERLQQMVTTVNSPAEDGADGRRAMPRQTL